jgi:hypothetical protein
MEIKTFTRRTFLGRTNLGLGVLWETALRAEVASIKKELAVIDGQHALPAHSSRSLVASSANPLKTLQFACETVAAKAYLQEILHRLAILRQFSLVGPGRAALFAKIQEFWPLILQFKNH